MRIHQRGKEEMTDTMTPIGLNLKRLRIAAGLTQQQLANMAGLSQSIVSQCEQGVNADPRGGALRRWPRC